MKSQKVVCQNCRAPFTIEPNDFGFYEKIKVPPPTFCPECRRQRRWAWRNNMSLYNRKCELCGKGVISLYHPDSGFTVYCNKCWWSDKWDPKSFGVDYDFSKPFFEQFSDLLKRVPQMAIVNDDGIASVNCEYTHDWWFSKDCYMCLSGWYVQNVMYSFFILSGRDIMDCHNLRSKNEWLYECVRVRFSYQLKNSDQCLACIDSQFLFGCQNCQNCFMCANLVGRKYHFKNEQYSKEEYEKILNDYRLDTWRGMEKAQKEYDEFILKYPRKHVFNPRSFNSTGDWVSDSKNVKNSFLVKGSENCSYCDFAGDSKETDKDCYDVTTTGGVAECYECVVGDHSQRNYFCLFSPKNMDVKYTQHCHSSKHLFGCVGIRNAKYCILNKEYTKEEYEKLIPKIIEQMSEMPYRDKKGNLYSYGEFYPIELSPFGYNETNAPEIVSLTREDALKKGYNWQDEIQKTTAKETLMPENIPDSIYDVKDDILNEILKCVKCGRNYKIIPNELNFYHKMKIPISRKCFYCRYQARLARTNPLKLWHRTCMCGSAGSTQAPTTHFQRAGKCKVEFETSYAPDRPEIVYCEKCYQAEVY